MRDKILEILQADLAVYTKDAEYYKRRLDEVSPYASLWQTVSCNYSAANATKVYIEKLIDQIQCD